MLDSFVLHACALCVFIEIAAVKFEERTSKNNNYTTERYNEEQFRKTWHSYEEDFILCVKEYYRHMAPLNECEKPDLFMGSIVNPIGNVWYNRSQKVGREKASGFLKSMVTLVGLSGDLFSNKSGRSSLATRLVAKGVPDEIGMMVTGHHSASGYSRYNRTKDLKMEAAILASSEPSLTYENALTKLSKKFVEEKIVGTSAELKPLLQRNTQNLPLALVDIQKETAEVIVTDVTHAEDATKLPGTDMVKIQPASAYEALHKLYDGIDWDLEISRNPLIARVLGGTNSQMLVGSNIAGNSFQNCTINISVVQPGAQHEVGTDKENKSPT